MKYTYQYVKDNRYNKNAPEARKMGDKFVLMTAISKALSPVPVYIFLNLGLHPDAITMFSFGFIFLSAASFVMGNAILGVLFMLIFGLLDSVDGDMARCKGPTKYGGVFDSFGADLFYALLPSSVGFYIFSHNISVGVLDSSLILLISFLVSISFILYRLINTKVLNFRRGLQKDQNHSQLAKESLGSGKAVKLVELYRHVLVRGNFFAEPGLIFWITIFVMFNLYQVIAIYFLVVLVYNLGYLVMNFVGTYMYFVKQEKMS